MAIISTLFAVIISVSAIDAYEFDDPSLEARYQALIEVVRCPKCLNTNLAGSDAPIAHDLRQLIYRLLHEGKSDKEIRTYLVERYGDFILYDPPLSPKTLVLWTLPVLGILVIAWVVLKVGFKRESLEPSPEEIRLLEELDEP